MTLTKEAAQGNAVTTRNQGQRFELLIALEWPQINLKTKTIHLYRSKTDNEMVFHMTDDAYEVLVRREQAPSALRLPEPQRQWASSIT